MKPKETLFKLQMDRNSAAMRLGYLIAEEENSTVFYCESKEAFDLARFYLARFRTLDKRIKDFEKRKVAKK